MPVSVVNDKIEQNMKLSVDLLFWCFNDTNNTMDWITSIRVAAQVGDN